MPRPGQQIAFQRVGKDEWHVAFRKLGAGHIWEFEAYKNGELPSGKPNIFWSERRQRFTAPSRLDVPPALLERTVAWIVHVASHTT